MQQQKYKQLETSDFDSKWVETWFLAFNDHAHLLTHQQDANMDDSEEAATGTFTCELCELSSVYTFYGRKPPNTRAVG